MHTPPLRVEKIGGTSMSRFPEIVDNIILRNPDDIYGRIYIVSAYSGITNELLEHKKDRQSRDLPAVQGAAELSPETA